ncbi:MULTISPECIES: hypothetical protein [unclassified Knoellia]|uniref:hypothetical protein n=1 Tax=Knoellia altitudinis TaxID=3404795 RepID=UPI00361BD7C0
MHRPSLRLRVAPLALAALTLGMPSVAVADTTPTPSPTTFASTTGTPSPSVSATESGSPTSSPSTSPSPSGTATSTPAPQTTTPSGSTPAAPAAPKAAAEPTFTLVPVGNLEQQQGRYAAHFLATQLKATGDHLNFPDTGGDLYADTGNTIDAILALDATGTGGTAATAATAWVERNVGSYVSYAPGAPASVGGAGKALVLAAVQDRDPRAFGGLDLVATLQDLVTAEGRFGSADNDYGVTINQALPMIGLHRAGVAIPDSSLAFLAEQQCPDGGVRGSLDETACVSDPDATAFAAQAFLAAGDTTHATAALTYLESRQRADGALTNASGEGANANTTGVAAQAFALGGREVPYLKAASFIMSLQWKCEVPSTYRGGITFTSADRAATTANLEKAIRATPQAVLGLVGGSLVTVENDGMAAGTTATPCAAPTTSSTATPTPSVSTTPTVTGPPTSGPTTGGPTAGGPATGDPISPEAGGPAVDVPGQGLAYTGASPRMPLLIAVLLLLAGAATILVSRRRGAHQ